MKLLTSDEILDRVNKAKELAELIKAVAQPSEVGFTCAILLRIVIQANAPGRDRETMRAFYIKAIDDGMIEALKERMIVLPKERADG